MKQEIIELYDEYTHTPMGRGVFLERLTRLAGSGVAAAALLPLLENNCAKAETVPGGADSRLDTGTVSYPGASGEIKGYLARPKDAGGKLPAVVVIHENKGLHPHIEDVARRAAAAGFLALAPDALSPLGGTPADVDEAKTKLRTLDRDKTREDFVAAVSFLKAHEGSTGKVGCVGFCWGGAMANQLAVHSPDMLAAVAFYGRQPAAEDVPKIKGSLLLHYAGLDKRINEGIPDFIAALKSAGVDYRMHMYDGVNHAFHNDTSEARYDAEAAKLAWKRTVDFLKDKLSG